MALAAVVILGFIGVLLALLATHLYIQLRKLQHHNKDILSQQCNSYNLGQRARDQRRSVLLTLADCHQDHPSRSSAQSPGPIPIETHSSATGTYAGMSADVPQTLPAESPKADSWAIRKVRSMERLTELTNELTPKKERGDPFNEPTRRDNDSFQDHGVFTDRRSRYLQHTDSATLNSYTTPDSDELSDDFFSHFLSTPVEESLLIQTSQLTSQESISESEGHENDQIFAIKSRISAGNLGSASPQAQRCRSRSAAQTCQEFPCDDCVINDVPKILHSSIGSGAVANPTSRSGTKQPNPVELRQYIRSIRLSRRARRGATKTLSHQSSRKLANIASGTMLRLRPSTRSNQNVFDEQAGHRSHRLETINEGRQPK
ncbi:hypothetical protein Dda_5732 [Drechslerella dactyloides]|uniref:Uncharacterized protein n=1 Tax=Drechslerella dactyloides TaxID=74499 RepID=A0AAD6J0W0_DREDA|nr:hypothetical protein Dda_5732 [Drechslerella dactyloides]